MSLRTRFTFTVEGLPADTFRVARLDGTEAISRPYRFELELLSDNPELDLGAILLRPARLAIGRYDTERRINGVVAEVSQNAARPDRSFAYRAVLVPHLWLMSLARTNRIHGSAGPLTVPDIVGERIAGCGGPVLGPGYAEAQLFSSYDLRDHVAQYEETDLDFISRLMEHVGIFYFFRQGPSQERLILTDGNLGLPPETSGRHLEFRPGGPLSADDIGAIARFDCTLHRMPRTVVLKDYNYRQPQLALQAEHEVDPDGAGEVAEYNAHFRTPEEGAELARIRAEEILAGRTIFTGDAFDPQLAAGYGLRLARHFRGSFNRGYLVTEVHHIGAAPADAEGAANGADHWTGYRNTFTAIPDDVAFRPARKTPWPRIAGIMHSHVDAEGRGVYAELDECGRYRVQVPFDMSGAGPMQGSQFMRMAQPYAGPNEGMHFPLRKNTEVVWGCIDGDPDRPIILGAVPNPLTVSPVTSRNNTTSMIQTPGGVRLAMHDALGGSAETPGAAPAAGGPRANSAGGVGGSEISANPADAWAPVMHVGIGDDPVAYMRLSAASGMTDPSIDTEYATFAAAEQTVLGALGLTAVDVPANGDTPAVKAATWSWMNYADGPHLAYVAGPSSTKVDEEFSLVAEEISLTALKRVAGGGASGLVEVTAGHNMELVVNEGSYS